MVLANFAQWPVKFYPQLKKVFIWESNGKSLSNCYSNCRGQPSGWIGWLLPSCTICTYRDPKLRQLDKKRSSPIIILLYSVWYCGRIWGQQIKNSFFWQPRHHDKHRLSHLNNRYEPYIDRHLIYRHMVDYCINCVLVVDLFTIILLVVAHLTFINISKKKIFYKYVHRKVPYCHWNKYNQYTSS